MKILHWVYLRLSLPETELSRRQYGMGEQNKPWEFYFRAAKKTGATQVKLSSLLSLRRIPLALAEYVLL